MPNCQTCGRKWTWMQTVKSLRNICPHCGTKQYPSQASRKKNLISTLILLILIFAANGLFDFSIGWSTVIVIFVTLAMISIHPLFLELSNKEEPYI
ncbi:TIGR04104 family putative zinc finger protein [Oceanobacillus salinisoli]|uniref:TIGR04104 family putative zinc finger protein n=1 Tax=Oceanobacillus salinisoli TaxID=2678611 RepID=UPI0012E29993|nr:TIGR04104 family putative zinc finger protein [Oceanobacillus salinisoli]